MTAFEIEFDRRAYRVLPDMGLVAEIEDELGGLAELKEKFSRNGWTVTELVALVQILLQRAGKTVDYIELGDKMLKDSFTPYLGAVRNFLKQVPD